VTEQTSLPVISSASISSPLSTEEKSKLFEYERIIEKNLTGFIRCGRALLAIREEKLWRENYSSFADYCRERFAIARSTADQLCRSTQVFESLATTLADSDTPVPADVPEIVVRPLGQLGGDELRVQTWRLAASLSPDKRPTRTIAARIAGLVREAIEPAGGNQKPTKSYPVFTAPIQRLAKISSFEPSVSVLHVKTPEQGRRIHEACERVVAMCRQVEDQLCKKFPDEFSDAFVRSH